MTQIHPLETGLEPPALFNNPFCYEPHPLCQLAADEVKAYVEQEPTLLADARRGKMFGVLVVAGTDGRTAFLAAYSGLLAGRNDWAYFVPAVYDAQQPDGHFKQTERQITAINEQLRADPTLTDDAAQALRAQRKLMSEELQLWLFGQYRLLNARGERKDLVGVWQDYHCSPRIKRRFPLPPGGTGDCCAPKLLQYAFSHGLRPLCMAEFWYGESPRHDIRHHLTFYPACRGKCKPLLTWMLQGMEVEPDPESLGFPRLGLRVVYEDEAVVVVNKPSGLLSVPGRQEDYSVATLVSQRWPGALLVHRLDMWTSGLLVAAKTLEHYHCLQEQFASRRVSKRYVALLEGRVATPRGRIELPLYADPMNRPRQVVDYERGKVAITDYEVLSESDGRTRVALFPHTGRTHQLRMHCAHQEGLGCPIVGDELYGHKADRLYLHAEKLAFDHPVTGRRTTFWQPADF